MLHVHKDRSDDFNLLDIANDFVGEKGNKTYIFGNVLCANNILTKLIKFKLVVHKI